MTQEDVILEYKKYESIKETARRIGISEGVVRKCLVGAGIIDTPTTRKIAKLRSVGVQQKDIAKLLGMSSSCINTNIPYERGLRIELSQTVNAQRIRKCRKKDTGNKAKKTK